MTALTLGIIIVTIWFTWGIQFVVLLPKSRGVAVKRDSRGRLGMIFEAIAYVLVYCHTPQFWSSVVAPGRVIAGLVAAAIAFYLSWNAIRHLGRQWRVDAGLNEDHRLVVTGAYRFVRHPIYSSMLWLFVMSILLLGTFPEWIVGAVLFVVGTEIRVRIEDGLLRERFGETFTEWQRRVPAYLPLVR